MAKKPPSPPPVEVPSEDELRIKIVYPFLLEQGFSPEDVKVEFAFKLRRGKTLEARPRADALVTKNGIAMYIIECKREDYEMSSADQEQAISYARMVQPKMPPYVLLTNGKNTFVIDAYLGQRVGKEEIVTVNGMPFSPASVEEAMRLRYEANKRLLCLTAQSLRSFIAKDLDEQIKIHSKNSLRPPYTPSTHIPRPEVWTRIEAFCKSSANDILPVLGPATIGKTSEIFSCITQNLLRAESDVLPIYIPLNLAGPDFIPHAAENFGWAFDRKMDVIRLIHDIDEISKLQMMTCVVYILDGADLTADALVELRRNIQNLLTRSSSLSVRHKVILVAQEATWLHLAVGSSIDLSGYSEAPVHVDRLTPEQSEQHIHALEEFYSIRIDHSGGLSSLPVIMHMLVQQMKSESGENRSVEAVLARQFRLLRSKASNPGNLNNTLTKIAVQLLNDPDSLDLSSIQAGLSDAVASGFLTVSNDMHGRETYAFSDDWIRYYVVGFLVWKLDQATPSYFSSLIEQASRRVEYARTLEWLSSVMSDNVAWRAVAQRRPLFYLACYQAATRILKILSVEEDACLWLAPYNGQQSSPWCAVIKGVPGTVYWGRDPNIAPDDAPSGRRARDELSAFSHRSLVQLVAADAVDALSEIKQWLPDRAREYRDRGWHRLWPAQYSVFERMRHRLRFRPYNLAEVARTLESPGYQGGSEMLQEIFENALRLAHKIADVELFGIREELPKKVRFEIQVLYETRESTNEYHLKSDDFGVEVVIGQYDAVQTWVKQDDFFGSFWESHGIIMSGAMPLHVLLGLPDYVTPNPWLDWSLLKRTNQLRKVNAVGNMAAYWLTYAISSALSPRLTGESRAKACILSHIESEGITEPSVFLRDVLNRVESVLLSFKEVGRIQTWIDAYSGFIIDGAYSVRELRENEVGLRIEAAIGNDSVVLTIQRIFVRTVEDPVPSEDDIDKHSVTVDSARVLEAARELLDRMVGFPGP